MSTGKPLTIKHSAIQQHAAQHAHPTTASAPMGKRQPKRKKAGVSMAPFIVVAIVIGIFVVGAYLSAKKNRAEAARIGLQLEATRMEAATIGEAAQKLLADIPGLGTGVDARRNTLKKLAEEVLGSPIVQTSTEPPPPPTTPEENPAESTPTTPEAPEATPPAVPESTPPTEEDENRPFGIMSREELDARRAAAQQRHEQRVDTPPPVAQPRDKNTTGAGLATPPVQPQQKAPSIQQLFLDASDLADTVLQAPMHARRIEANLQEDLNLLQQEQRLELAARRVQSITSLRDAASHLLDEATQARESFDQLADKLETLHQEHVSALAEQKRREEEERKRQEHARQLAQDQARIAAATTTIEQHWQAFRYDEALALATALLSETSTPEQRPHAELLHDQAQALSDMRLYLIESLNKAPIQWGWRQSGGSRHITGADAKAIHFTGGSSPWDQVVPAQMDFIIKHVLGAATTLPSLQVRHAAALGLFYHFLGKPADAAFYVTRGCESRPASAADIRRLTPFIK